MREATGWPVHEMRRRGGLVMANHAERLRNIAAQIGHPDYSLAELKQDLLDVADDVEISTETLEELLAARQRP